MDPKMQGKSTWGVEGWYGCWLVGWYGGWLVRDVMIVMTH